MSRVKLLSALMIMLISFNLAFAADPIAHYTFDADASDATGNFNAVLGGDAAIVDDAERGKVLQLTADGFVDVPLAVTTTMENFSFTAWVYFAGKNAYAGIMGMGVYEGRDAPYWDFHLRGDGTLSFYSTGDEAAVWPGNGDCMFVESSNLLDYPGWMHLAFCFTRGTGGAVYTNGVAQTLAVWNAGYPNEGGVSPKDVAWGHVYIGKDYFNQQTLTDTKIDDFMFFDTALTPEEVNAIFTGATAVEKQSTTVPSQFELAHNFPNPFNPTTEIQYTLGENAYVEIFVYDILGHHVATLVNEYQTDGTYRIVWDASKASAGIYFYTMKVDNHSISTQKMMLMK